MSKINSVVVEIECDYCHEVLTRNLDNEGSEIIICECGNEIKIVYELEVH